MSHSHHMRQVCGNCPFRKKGGIVLEEGRVAEIIDEGRKDDMHVFHCHKTVYRRDGSETPNDGTTRKVCLGYVAVLMKERHSPVLTRLAIVTGQLLREDIERAKAITIEPPEAPKCNSSIEPT